MNETLAPKEKSIPTFADMIKGTENLSNSDLENMRKHIDCLLGERKSKRRKELEEILIGTFKQYRAEFPEASFYINIEADEVEEVEDDLLELDLLELIEENI